jgi:hypothetical protein
MKRTYQYVSDFAVVMFDAPERMSEVEADEWARYTLADIVNEPDAFWLEDVLEGE